MFFAACLCYRVFLFLHIFCCNCLLSFFSLCALFCSLLFLFLVVLFSFSPLGCVCSCTCLALSPAFVVPLVLLLFSFASLFLCRILPSSIVLRSKTVLRKARFSGLMFLWRPLGENGRGGWGETGSACCGAGGAVYRQRLLKVVQKGAWKRTPKKTPKGVPKGTHQITKKW